MHPACGACLHPLAQLPTWKATQPQPPELSQEHPIFDPSSEDSDGDLWMEPRVAETWFCPFGASCPIFPTAEEALAHALECDQFWFMCPCCVQTVRPGESIADFPDFFYEADERESPWRAHFKCVKSQLGRHFTQN